MELHIKLCPVLMIISIAFGTDNNSKRVKRELDIEVPIEEDPGPAPAAGSTYIRWGRTSCPDSSKLVYKGFVGGSFYTQVGGGSNYLCMTSQPIWGNYNDADAALSKIHGAEYETNWPFQSDNIDGNSHKEHDVPCAVCMTTGRQANIMIPGRNECEGKGWTLEYNGYIMSDHHTHKRTQFICMDAAPEADPAGYENKNGALFYYTEAACGSLPCPPYVNNREITCAVCSK